MLTNYLISDQETLYHFFYKPGEGICFKEKNPTHWNEYQILYRDGMDGFGAFCDSSGNIHLICTNAAHDIIYLFKRQEQWLKYVLASGKEEVTPLYFTLSFCNTYMNLFYTAAYADEVILVHCILGDNAQPMTLDVLSSDCTDFFVFENRVYYTNKQGTLGFQDASDGKPNQFQPVVEGGRMPYILSADGKALFVYKKNNMIYLENDPVFEDYSSTKPILLKTDGKLILQWQSGSFIRYVTSFNNGKTWSSPMRFMSNGRNLNCYQKQEGNYFEHYYGTHNNKDLNIFGRPNILPPSPSTQKEFRTTASLYNDAPAAHKTPEDKLPDEKPPVQKPSAYKPPTEEPSIEKPPADTPPSDADPLELQKLKIMIEMMFREVKELKAQIRALKTSLQQPLPKNQPTSEENSHPVPEKQTKPEERPYSVSEKQAKPEECPHPIPEKKEKTEERPHSAPEKKAKPEENPHATSKKTTGPL